VFAEELIVGGSLRAVRTASGAPEGFAVDLRLNWFRSLPVSCVEELVLSVDGVHVPPRDIKLDVAGTRFPLEEAPGRDDVWWSCGEPATLLVGGRRLDPGPHELACQLRVRIPYFPPGPDGVWPTMYDRAVASAVIP
jgi:hypothetical protein